MLGLIYQQVVVVLAASVQIPLHPHRVMAVLDTHVILLAHRCIMQAVVAVVIFPILTKVRVASVEEVKVPFNFNLMVVLEPPIQGVEVVVMEAKAVVPVDMLVEVV